MANLSYARFQNTLADLRDCYVAMRDMADGDEPPLSRDEAAAQHDLINLCKKIVELAEEQEEQEDDVEQPFKVFSQDIAFFDLSLLPVSKGNHRYLINVEWFIWRDMEHHFLSRVSDIEYYYQLNAYTNPNDMLEEAFDVIEHADDSYGYKDQKNFD